MITNREEGKGKPPRLFPKTGYPLGYPEPALQQKTEERDYYIGYPEPALQQKTEERDYYTRLTVLRPGEPVPER